MENLTYLFFAGLILLVFARPIGKFGHRCFANGGLGFFSEKSLTRFFRIGGLLMTGITFHTLFLKAPTPEFVSWIRRNEAFLIANRDPERVSGPFFHGRDYATLREEVEPVVKEVWPQSSRICIGLEEGERPVVVCRAWFHWIVPESIAAKQFQAFEVVLRHEGCVVIKDIRD